MLLGTSAVDTTESCLQRLYQEQLKKALEEKEAQYGVQDVDVLLIARKMAGRSLRKIIKANVDVPCAKTR